MSQRPTSTARKLADSTSGLQRDKPAITVEEIDLTSGNREWWTLIQFQIQEASGEQLTGGIGMDITSLKEAEQIHKLNEDLERRVAQRTEQLEMKTRNWNRSPTPYQMICGRHCATWADSLSSSPVNSATALGKIPHVT